MRIKNSTTGNIIIGDLPNGQNLGLSVPADVEVLIFNEDAEKSLQLRAFLTAGTILNLGPEEPSTGFPEADAQPSIVGPVQILIVDAPNPGEVLTATGPNTAEWQPGGGGGGADASTTVKGITKLSVAPVVPTNPIAAGDNDPRMTNPRTPSGAASGDLGGSYPSPTVEKINGVAVTGVPSTGQVITATGPAAATWQTPGGSISPSILTAKGSLISATGAGAPAELPVGLGGRFLQADSMEATGLKWADVPVDVNKIDKAVLTARGTLITRDGMNNTPQGLPVGTNGQVLTANSAAPGDLGMEWQNPTGGPASALATTGADVVVNTAAPPTTGQVLTATSPTAANWQTPSGGGSNPYAGTNSFVKTNSWGVVDEAGSPVSSEAMAYDGTNLWMLSTNNYIQKVSTSGVLLNSYLMPDNSPIDIHFAFSHIWVVCQGSQVLYKISPADGSIVETYNGGRAMERITSNANYIFTCKERTMRFDPVAKTFFNLEERSEASSPDSIVSGDSDTLWLIDKTSALIKHVYREPIRAQFGFEGMVFMAVSDGTAGNSISISFNQNGGEAFVEPEVTVVGDAITVKLLNGAGGTKEMQIVRAVNAHPQASLLVSATTSDPNRGHNYNGAVDFLTGGLDHEIASVNVSASGLPVAGTQRNGFLWVTMNNGDMLKIDNTDIVLATFPSGATALSGIVGSGSGAFLHITETAPADKLHVFDVANEYFVDSLAAGNVPNDVVWNNAENLWSIDRASATIRRLDRKTGALLGSIDVSASGLPRRGVFANGFLWVCMSNADLLQIDQSTDLVQNTFPSGQTELAGITQGNGSTLYVSDPSSQEIIPFDLGGFTFGTPLDVSLINTPNDIAWDGGGAIWSLDFTSTTIKRLDTSGAFQGDVVVSAAGGLPLRLGPTIQNGLWVTMDNGKLLRCDPYGTANIREELLTGMTGLVGITSFGGSDFFLSATGTNLIDRFYYDTGAFHRHLIRTVVLADTAHRIREIGTSLWTTENTVEEIRRVSPADGSTISFIDIAAYGAVSDFINSASVIYANVDGGNVLAYESGSEQAFATLTHDAVVYKAGGTGINGNLMAVTITGTNTGGAATITAFTDSLYVTVDVEPGVTTAQAVVDAINGGLGGQMTATTASPLTVQTTLARTNLSGGGDIAPSFLGLFLSEKTALAGFAELSGQTNPIGFTSPSTGYMRFVPNGARSGFTYNGVPSITGSDQVGITADAADVYIAENSGGGARIAISTMLSTGLFGFNLNSGNPFIPVLIGAFAYILDNGLPVLYRVSKTTNNVDKQFSVGLGQGSGSGAHSDGTSMWTYGQFGQDFSGLERREDNARVVMESFPVGDSGGNRAPMVSVGGALFVRQGTKLHRFAANLG